MTKNKPIFIVIVITIAAFLRFYNLMHDSPYFFNPDERNMAIAITRFVLPSKITSIPSCIYSEFFSNRPATNCSLNPHFFAYSQFPLYLSYVSDQTVHFISSIFNNLRITKTNFNTNEILITTFPAAIFWLRFWSALSSTLTVYFVYLISKKLLTTYYSLLAAFFAVFTPGLIQSAHFGTTESLLTMLFLASIYFSIHLYEENTRKLKSAFSKDLKIIIWLSLSIGIAIGSKLTGIFFFFPPLVALIVSCNQLKLNLKSKKARLQSLLLLRKLIFQGALILVVTLIITVLTSPYNLVEWRDFQSAVFGYEKDVATGLYPAFYTSQFVDTTPVIFQAQRIFPYVLGWPVFILGSLGLLMMVFNIISNFLLHIIQSIKYYVFRIRDKKMKNNNILTTYLPAQAGYFLLTTSFLIYFLPNAFLYAKWTRFMTPIFPFFSIFAAYALFHINSVLNVFRSKYQVSLPADATHQALQAGNPKSQINSKTQNSNRFHISLVIGYWILVISSVLPGLAFMSIYTNQDSRITASKWIYQNIPDNSYVLSETANVVDIPLGLPNYNLKPIASNLTVISFDFYHLDENPLIFERLLSDLERADYIFIPSRRLFANYTRLANKYPRLNRYYQLLFSGALGFEKVAEINSFPSLKFGPPAGGWNLKFNDEQSEETYTVFDHPVVRIYKKTKPMTIYEYEYLLKG